MSAVCCVCSKITAPVTWEASTGQAVVDCFLQTPSSSKEGRRGHYIQSLPWVLISFLKEGNYDSQSTLVLFFVFIKRASEAQ